MLKKILLPLLLLIFPAMAQPQPTTKAYLKVLQAYGLGFPSVEFYEAFVVVDIQEPEVGRILKDISVLCSEFPKLDGYVIKVFNNAKAADPQLLKGATSFNTGSTPDLIRKGFIAEINPKGEVTLFPLIAENRKTLVIRRNWCKGGT